MVYPDAACRPPSPFVTCSWWRMGAGFQRVTLIQTSDGPTLIPKAQKRFVLGEGLDGRAAVRAAQGHSVALEAPILAHITSPEQLPGPAVHVTRSVGVLHPD